LVAKLGVRERRVVAMDQTDERVSVYLPSLALALVASLTFDLRQNERPHMH
jgi:hypothetical protein